MLAVSSVTFAQFTNGGSKSAAGNNSDYNKVYVSFNVGSFTESETGSKDYSVGLIGFNVGYAHAFNLDSKLPLFVELGGEFNFHTGSKEKVTYTFMDISVPVNLTYRFEISNKFAFAPYAGLNLKVNLLGKAKAEGASESESFFDKDVWGEDQTASRFQVGMNLGFNCIFSQKFSAGYRFQPDFIKYQSYSSGGTDWSTNASNHFFTFGYIF